MTEHPTAGTTEDRRADTLILSGRTTTGRVSLLLLPVVAGVVTAMSLGRISSMLLLLARGAIPSSTIARSRARSAVLVSLGWWAAILRLAAVGRLAVTTLSVLLLLIRRLSVLRLLLLLLLTVRSLLSILRLLLTLAVSPLLAVRRRLLTVVVRHSRSRML